VQNVKRNLARKNMQRKWMSLRREPTTKAKQNANVQIVQHGRFVILTVARIAEQVEIGVATLRKTPSIRLLIGRESELNKLPNNNKLLQRLVFHINLLVIMKNIHKQ
jgi:hypothetical protein